MRTLDDLLLALFPRGTSFPEVAGFEVDQDELPAPVSHDDAPSWPPDVFAYSAKLMELSGAYHHVAPATAGPQPAPEVRRLTVQEDERKFAVDVGRRWARSLRKACIPVLPPTPPPEVEELWGKLRGWRAAELFVETDVHDAPVAWWRAAMMLMMMADEAARDLGFDHDPRNLTADPTNALELFLDVVLYLPATERRAGADSLYSFSFANQNILGVLPKSRTPSVGCTLRSLSHHLALVPPGGEVRVRWLSPHGADAAACGDRPLKILVVPYPYSIDAECFEPLDVASVATPATGWGWFHIAARWLGPSRRGEALRRAALFADFVVGLVEDAGADGLPVGAVVLPEAALNEVFFATLFDVVLRNCPNVELLVSGTSELPLPDGGTRPGNFVAQGVFLTQDRKRQGVRTIREKHHRWRLDRGQIEVYGLGSQLNPATHWWESIDITSRSLDIVAFRPGATMTTLICEDLARVDPCQGAVRAVGPSLLVALLMDGSQLAARWPGRYATVLAEDPGCSVLTVSSLGLINRTRLRDGSRPRWSVALWRDDSGPATEIILTPGHHAVALVVDPEWRTECTLDGRLDGGEALAWKLRTTGAGSYVNVRATRPVPDWITQGTE